MDTVVSVEFRDGERFIPYYLAVLMKGIETHTMTYDEAVLLANQQMLKDRLKSAQARLVYDHFRQNR